MKTIAATAAALLLTGCNSFMEDVTNGGFQAEQYAPGQWQLTARNVDFNDQDRPALYKAAVVAKANGYPFFQVVNYQESFAGLGRGASLSIAGVQSADAPLACLAEEYQKYRCRTYNTDETLTRVGTQIGKTPWQINDEVRREGLPKEAAKKK